MKVEYKNSTLTLDGEHQIYDTVNVRDYLQGIDIFELSTLKLHNINAKEIIITNDASTVRMKHCVIDQVNWKDNNVSALLLLNSTVEHLHLGSIDELTLNYFISSKIEIGSLINMNLIQTKCHLLKLLYLGSKPSIKACDIHIFELYKQFQGKNNKVNVPRKIEGIKYCNVQSFASSSKLFIKRDDEYIDLLESKQIILKHKRLFLKDLDKPIDLIPFMMYLI